MHRFKTFLTVIGAVTILVLAANTVAYAATGGKFILGRTNKASKVSTLKRTTSGAALNLVTTSSSNAPMTVNGKGKVANLNADLLDGLDSTSFTHNVRVYTGVISSPTSDYRKQLALPAGKYVVNYSAYLSGATSDYVECYVRTHSPTNTTISYTADSAFTSGTSDPALSATGLVTQDATHLNEFGCFANSKTFTTISTEPIQIVVTKVDRVLSTTSLRLSSGASRVAK